MAGVFVDAGILLHAFDDLDPAKQQRARQWLTVCWERRCGRLSTQVLCEFYAGARRRFATAISAGDARAEVRRYQLWKPWPIDQSTIETAWAAESRHGIDYWDALQVAAAQHLGCRYLITESIAHGTRFDRLHVLDPFVLGPEVLDSPTP